MNVFQAHLWYEDSGECGCGDDVECLGRGHGVSVGERGDVLVVCVLPSHRYSERSSGDHKQSETHRYFDHVLDLQDEREEKGAVSHSPRRGV